MIDEIRRPEMLKNRMGSDNNELTLQPGFVELQTEYMRLFKSNKELLANMYYAKHVQQGILPNVRHFQRLFSDYFVMYKPQNIIGGDLYWICKKGNIIYFAVGDCTGHGVSGAMLSVMALGFLNYLVLGKDFSEVGEVLQELDKKWIEAFQQGDEAGYNNDWLEIGLCAFNLDTRELQFSGAFNKLVYIENNELKELIGNKFPIGGWQLEKSRQYNTYTITISEGTAVYLFTDGFKDQFGVATKKRYSSRNLRNLLLRSSAFPMEKQGKLIDHEFDLYRGSEDQTDDVCMMGIRL